MAAGRWERVGYLPCSPYGDRGGGGDDGSSDGGGISSDGGGGGSDGSGGNRSEGRARKLLPNVESVEKVE